MEGGLASASKLENLDVRNAYDEGYRNRSGRENYFPRNKDVDAWLCDDIASVIIDINRYFSKYQGKFTCHESKL